MSSNYDALSGGVSAWGLGGMGAVRRGGFGSGGALGTAQVPSWVVNPSNPPDMAQDWVNNRAWSKTGGIITPASSLLTVSRALQKTDLFPTSSSGFAYTTFGSGAAAVTSLGLSVEEARTNVLLNSTVPATQTTASLGTGVYTLWVNGSGSATPSAGSATITGATAATNGSPGGFTVSVAGTVTVTVSGSLNAFQCELGIFGTSLIITAGAPVTRPAELVSLTSSPTFGGSLTLYSEAIPQAPTAFGNNQIILNVNDNTASNTVHYLRALGTNAMALADRVAGAFQTVPASPGSFAQNTASKIAFAITTGDAASSVNGGAVTTAAPASIPGSLSRVHFGARATNDTHWCGLIKYTALWLSQRVPNAQLPTITT